MLVTGAEDTFLERLAGAVDLAEVIDACEQLKQARRTPGGVDAKRQQALADALHAHLSKVSRHADFQRWLDSYFGRRIERFRSALQQPAFIYYPALAPVPWFDSAEVNGLSALRDSIAQLRGELLEAVGSQPGFSPYVESEASRDPRWRDLAGSQAWVAIHLLKGGVWNGEVVERLPATRAFLAQAPLAQCPPHAPECFLSRLRPGVVLPPHHGTSNVKLTVHMAVDLPPRGCTITVGGITKSWPLDDFLVFDDSFLHSASNRAERDRTVLIMDVWHPALSREECRALAHAIMVLDRVQSAWQLAGR